MSVQGSGMNDRKTTEKSPQPAQPQPGTRRQWLLGAGGVLAAAGAGVWAWQRWSGQAGAGQTAAEQAFWALQLPGLDGQLQALQQYQGRPLLVNFWATWCPPCVRELPLLNHVARQQPQVQMLGIAVDKAANVTKWLQREPLAFPVLLAETGGMGLTRELGNINGGLPFSILWDATGRMRQRRIGAFSEDILQRWMTSV
jgi:thiol-disulfide isomerase/thioredoxin